MNDAEDDEMTWTHRWPPVLRTTLLIAAILAGAGCKKDAPPANAGPPQPIAEADVPAELKPALAKADKGFKTLQQTLGKRLKEALSTGGPPLAIDVCNMDALKLTSQVSEELGITVGRTSHKLRNPGNSAPWWAEKVVSEGSGKASAHSATVFDLGKSVGVLRPIAIQKPCLNCHGDPAKIHAQVTLSLSKEYPRDQATGFTEGDLRGFFWAEVPK